MSNMRYQQTGGRSHMVVPGRHTEYQQMRSDLLAQGKDPDMADFLQHQHPERPWTFEPPIRLHVITLYSSGITVGHSRQRECLTVGYWGMGLSGKQQNQGQLHKRLADDGQHVELDSSGATVARVPLDEWQTFADTLHVRVNGNSLTTIPLTDQLIQMARDVVAYRRTAPSDAEWAAELAAAESDESTGKEPRMETVTSETIEVLKLDELELDPLMQPRIGINHDKVREYADRMEDGDQFPELEVHRFEDVNFVTDGWHRVYAADLAGIEALPCKIIVIDEKRVAIMASARANSRHGLDRTNEDKRKAVETVLRDEEGYLWSDREVARWVNVHHSTVAKVREELEASGEIARSTERKYIRDGQEITVDTSNIGQNQPLDLSETVEDDTISVEGPDVDGRYLGLWITETVDGEQVLEEATLETREEGRNWFTATVKEAQYLWAARQAEDDTDDEPPQTRHQQDRALIAEKAPELMRLIEMKGSISMETAAFIVREGPDLIDDVIARDLTGAQAREIIEMRQAAPHEPADRPAAEPASWASRYLWEASAAVQGTLPVFHASPIYGALGEAADALNGILLPHLAVYPGWVYTTLVVDGQPHSLFLLDQDQVPAADWRTPVGEAGWNISYLHVGQDQDAVRALAAQLLEGEAEEAPADAAGKIVQLPPDVLSRMLEEQPDSAWEGLYAEIDERYCGDYADALMARIDVYYVALYIHAETLDPILREGKGVTGSLANSAIIVNSLVAGEGWQQRVTDAGYNLVLVDLGLEDAREWIDSRLPAHQKATPASNDPPESNYLKSILVDLGRRVAGYRAYLDRAKPGDAYERAIIAFLVGTQTWMSFHKYTQAVQAIEDGWADLLAQLQAVDDPHAPDRDDRLHKTIKRFVDDTWQQTTADAAATPDLKLVDPAPDSDPGEAAK